MEDGTVIDSPVKKTLGGIEFTVTFIDPWTPRDKQTIGDHGGLVIHAGGEDFWFAGQGITITFKGADGGPPLVGIDLAEEGVFDAHGKWVAGPPAQRRSDASGPAHPFAAGQSADSEGAVLPVSIVRRRHRQPSSYRASPAKNRPSCSRYGRFDSGVLASMKMPSCSSFSEHVVRGVPSMT